MNNLRYYREKQGISQKELSALLNVAPNTYNQWETGKREPDFSMMSRIADLFDISIDELLGRENAQRSSPADNWIPVLGKVAAGIPVEAIENFDSDDPDDWEQISADMARNGKHIALRINGDSMEPRMKVGDVVIVRIQETIEDGETAIVKVNGDETTCKKIKKTSQGLTLISLNPSYAPIFYTAEECETMPVRIFGKVVELRAKL